MGSCSENHNSKHENIFDSFFQKLFTDAQNTTDIDLKVKDNSFSGHKLILSMWSPYFADEFEMKKNINVIQLKDVNPKYFQVMLRFMYGFPLNCMETTEEICGLYYVAKEFQVSRLMKECNNRLNNIEISASNIFDMLQAADCLQNEGTKDRCLYFFQENTKEVFAENDLSKISPFMMSFLLTSKKLSLDSLSDLFIQIFAWGKNRCMGDSRFSTPREAVEEFFPQLPFASLRVEEFATLYTGHDQYFYENEVIQIFMNYSFPEGKVPCWYNKDCQIEIKSSN